MDGVQLFGWCELDRTRLAELATAGRYDQIAAAHGDFVLVLRGPSADTVITSAAGVVNYFYARGPAGYRHGGEVATVASAAGLDWRWDFGAVADYLRLGHPLGEATLHAGVRRFPAGTVTTIAFPGDVVRQTALPQPPGAAADEPGAAADEPGRPGPERATGELLAAVEAVEAVEAAGPDCALSMSGGLDSRVLLAALLRAGRRPRLLVSGMPGSFDRRVATAIADRFRLPLTAVTVTEADVREGAAEISAVTNGLLPASHWAGLAHLRRVRTDAPVLHGANGEFARGYYAPPRGLAVLRIAALPRAGFAEVLLANSPEPFRGPELALLCPPLRAALEDGAVRDRLSRAADGLPGRTALAVCDEFFRAARGRQKTSADLAAIGRYAAWRVPFFAPGWVSAVRALPRRWKLGDALHRRMIETLCPDLLRFPEEGYGPTVRARPPLRYWTGGPRPENAPHYLDQRIFRGDVLDAASGAIGELMEPVLFERVTAGQRSSGMRPHAAFALLALAAYRGPGAAGAAGAGGATAVSTPYLSSS